MTPFSKLSNFSNKLKIQEKNIPPDKYGKQQKDN